MPVSVGFVRAAIQTQQEWTALRNEVIKQSHEVFDDVRNLVNVWNRHLEHPSENPDEVKNKVTTSLKEILFPESWKLRLKILELPVEIPKVIQSGTSGSRPTGTGSVITGSGSAMVTTGPNRPTRPIASLPGLVGSMLDNKPDGLSVNGGLRVEAPFISKLLGLLW